MRLIDGDALKKKMIADADTYILSDGIRHGYHNCEQLVEDAPTIEKRKTGKWIWKTLDVYKCSECETETHVDECMEEPIYNFCPYCGARLVQEGEDNERA